MRIALSTGGGDAPGLNAVIRAAVLSAVNRGWEVLGVKKGSVSTDEREEGFRDTIQKEFPGIAVISPIFYGEANAAKSLSMAEDILTSHADLTGLFASNESSTVGAVRAIRFTVPPRSTT